MKSGTVIALVVLTGYIGFEAYAVRKARYRTEPAYIYNMLVEAKAAAELCDTGDPELLGKFDKTLLRVTQQYRDDLADKNSSLDAASIDKKISDQNIAASSKLKRFHELNGCSHKEMAAHQQRIRIYARRSR